MVSWGRGCCTLGRSRESGLNRVPLLGPPTSTTAFVVGAELALPRIGTWSEAILLGCCSQGLRCFLVDFWASAVSSRLVSSPGAQARVCRLVCWVQSSRLLCRTMLRIVKGVVLQCSV